jgi:hypothetical protein
MFLGVHEDTKKHYQDEGRNGRYKKTQMEPLEMKIQSLK